MNQKLLWKLILLIVELLLGVIKVLMLGMELVVFSMMHDLLVMEALFCIYLWKADDWLILVRNG
jgi:hypothetical protein